MKKISQIFKKFSKGKKKVTGHKDRLSVKGLGRAGLTANWPSG